MMAWQQQRRPQASCQQHEPKQQRSFHEPLHFDPADNGSYPCKRHLHAVLWQDLATSQDAGADVAAGPDEAAAADSISEQARINPFGWVPDLQPLADAAAAPGSSAAVHHHQDSISSVRPKTAQIRSHVATSLPLELFDSPEMEGVDVNARLQDAAAAAAAAGVQGSDLPALSRFFGPDGSFSWQPCTVLSFDK